MSRYIMMRLADDVTNDRCGKCPARSDDDGYSWRPYCGTFRQELRIVRASFDSYRLDQCKAGELSGEEPKP